MRVKATYLANGPHISLSIGKASYELINANEIYSGATDEGGVGIVTAPMHGAVIEVLVREGDTVKEGQRLAILEAMKMQHEILADIDGKVKSINVSVGEQVTANALMLEIEEN